MTGRLLQIVLVLTMLGVLVCLSYSLSVCGENLSWDIRLIVWGKFHRFCGMVVSSICVTLTTAFSCYGFHFVCVCMLGVFHATEKDSMQHGCVIVLL